MSQNLRIVGGSVRAAAASAVKSGWRVIAADRFADEDLRAIAQATAVSDYPGGLEIALEGSASGGWMYTGALENEPELVDRWRGIRRLWGNGGEALRRVRDPFELARAFARHGIDCLSLSRGCDGLPIDGSWLQKPFRSAGGAGIAYWTGQRRPAEAGYYYQRRQHGRPVSSVYLAVAGHAIWCGATESWHGAAWLGANGFGYAGSIGPLTCDTAARDQWTKLGEVIAGEFGLIGLFGVDAIQDDAGWLWPLEVNPRLVASVEVLERAGDWQAVDSHISACRELHLAPPPAAVRQAGKAIVYAAAACRVGPELAQWIRRQNERARSPLVADIPAEGSTLQSGWPILTLLAEGTDREQVESELRLAAAEVRQLLRPAVAYR